MSTRPHSLTSHAKQRSEARRIGREGLRAATLFGDRFVQPDGAILHLVTKRACERLSLALGLTRAYIDDQLRGVYVVMTRSGALVTVGRRYSGHQGRIRRS